MITYLKLHIDTNKLQCCQERLQLPIVNFTLGLRNACHALLFLSKSAILKRASTASFFFISFVDIFPSCKRRENSENLSSVF